jgi:hypothetical protein
MTEKSLWPELKVKREKTPYAILKEQAGYLAENTNGLVTALVTRKTDSDGDVHLKFFFVAPALGDYRYLLLTLWHNPVMVYPVHDWQADEEIASEAELVEYLKTLFSSDNTQSVLSSLINQSLEGSD